MCKQVHMAGCMCACVCRRLSSDSFCGGAGEQITTYALWVGTRVHAEEPSHMPALAVPYAVCVNTSGGWLHNL